MTRRPGDPGSEGWVSVDDVAAHLGVRKDSIYRWIDNLGLPARKIGKLWKFKLSEVDAWVHARGENLQARASNRVPVVARPLVLLVDDDELIRDTVAEYLNDNGYEMLTAGDGQAALDILERTARTPELILLDLQMPGMDGRSFREAQLRDPAISSIPVVVVTAVPDAHLTGAAAILHKPLRLPALKSIIDGVIADRLRRVTQ